VARAALDGRLDAERLRALGPVAGPASVRGIRGIGEFWSSGIYLRGCGIVDVFPDEPLRPYRMWAAFLLRVAAGQGIVPGVAGREATIRRLSGR
jgi:DNA-3-methyladenine glycosylase II